MESEGATRGLSSMFRKVKRKKTWKTDAPPARGSREPRRRFQGCVGRVGSPRQESRKKNNR